MLRTFAIGSLEETTIFEPDGTGATFDPTYFVLGVTYSRSITDRVGFGFTFNWINESIPRVGASGFGFDAGVQYTNVVNISNLDTRLYHGRYWSVVQDRPDAAVY